jgi:hypothetical protein
MAARSARTVPVPLQPDLENRNPFRGLPADYPSAHSRFPIVPAEDYGDLSFVPSVGENASPEGRQNEMTPAARDAWRRVMTVAVGDLIDDEPDSKNG